MFSICDTAVLFILSRILFNADTAWFAFHSMSREKIRGGFVRIFYDSLEQLINCIFCRQSY